MPTPSTRGTREAASPAYPYSPYSSQPPPAMGARSPNGCSRESQHSPPPWPPPALLPARARVESSRQYLHASLMRQARCRPPPRGVRRRPSLPQLQRWPSPRVTHAFGAPPCVSYSLALSLRPLRSSPRTAAPYCGFALRGRVPSARPPPPWRRFPPRPAAARARSAPARGARLPRSQRGGWRRPAVRTVRGQSRSRRPRVACPPPPPPSSRAAAAPLASCERRHRRNRGSAEPWR